MANDLQSADIQCPSILFRLNGGLYCADSRYVSTIMELPKFSPLPDTPPYITGIFPFRGGSVTMFDLRAALKLPSLSTSFSEFSEMLDARKQDHINWVETLERSVAEGTPFPLATDPHNCKLGKWYDSFQSDSAELTAHLAKLVEPHKRLHESALRTESCRKNFPDSPTETEVCQKQVLHEIRNTDMPQVLKVLDEAKDIFHAREFHEMVLVLSGKTSLGLVVDEVLSVEMVEEEVQGAQHQLVSYSPYIGRVVKSPKYNELILEVNMDAVMHTAEEEADRRAAAMPTSS